MKKMNKRAASIQSLYPAIMAFILIAVLLGVGLIILTEFAGTTAIDGTAAETALNSSVTALDDFVDWFPIIVVVLAAAVIIGIVMRGFAGSSKL